MSVDRRRFDADVNILGTLSLLEAACTTTSGRPPRFIMASTGGALYGDFVTSPNAETFAKGRMRRTA